MSREKIIEADELVVELQEWLRERGWRIDKPHVTPDGRAIFSRFYRLPENEESQKKDDNP